jgi:hypothetical protein
MINSRKYMMGTKLHQTKGTWYGIIGLWIFLAPLSTIFQLYHGGQFFFIVRRGNIRNRIKKPICHKSMTNVPLIRPPDEMGELLLVWDE